MATDLIPVDECIVHLEFQHEILETILNIGLRLICTTLARGENAQCVWCSSIHGGQVGCGTVEGKETRILSKVAGTRPAGNTRRVYALSCSARNVRLYRSRDHEQSRSRAVKRRVKLARKQTSAGGLLLRSGTFGNSKAIRPYQVIKPIESHLLTPAISECRVRTCHDQITPSFPN